jgi:hypothetical protein
MNDQVLSLSLILFVPLVASLSGGKCPVHDVVEKFDVEKFAGQSLSLKIRNSFFAQACGMKLIVRPIFRPKNIGFASRPTIQISPTGISCSIIRHTIAKRTKLNRLLVTPNVVMRSGRLMQSWG